MVSGMLQQRSDQGGSGDLGEGEILGVAFGALLPVEEELAVAVGEAGGGIDGRAR